MYKMNKSKKEIGFKKVLQEYQYQLILGITKIVENITIALLIFF